ncbi:MAG: hypothetical protein ACJKTH_01595 [Patescibacteria group bacterium UBA2163]
MSDFLKQYQNIFIIVALIVIAFIGYTFFFAGEDNDASLTVEQAEEAPTEVGQELIGLLLELRSIQLDTSLFSDERFQSLQDFGQQIISEPVGRPNPFAPLGQ